MRPSTPQWPSEYVLTGSRLSFLKEICRLTLSSHLTGDRGLGVAEDAETLRLTPLGAHNWGVGWGIHRYTVLSQGQTCSTLAFKTRVQNEESGFQIKGRCWFHAFNYLINEYLHFKKAVKEPGTESIDCEAENGYMDHFQCFTDGKFTGNGVSWVHSSHSEYKPFSDPSSFFFSLTLKHCQPCMLMSAQLGEACFSWQHLFQSQNHVILFLKGLDLVLRINPL